MADADLSGLLRSMREATGKAEARLEHFRRYITPEALW